VYSQKLEYLFFCAPGHIIQYFPVQALYPEPCTRPYQIRIYHHSSVLRALTAGRFRPTRPATVVGKACFIYNLLGVRPAPTVYSLYALNPLLPGLEPRIPQSTLAKAMQSFLVGVVLSPQTGGEVTNTGYESMPASLGLMWPQIQAFKQCSVLEKPCTS
jgi:hypothetical protein